MLSDIQCFNCGAYLDFEQLLPQQTLEDIRSLIEDARCNDARPYHDADLDDIQQRFTALGMYPSETEKITS